jgi:transcription antitermination factor NusA-like protein
MEKGWTDVYTTANDYEAEIAKNILENAGIQTVILNQHDSAFPTFGEYTVYVSEADKEKAVELLSNLKEGE